MGEAVDERCDNDEAVGPLFLRIPDDADGTIHFPTARECEGLHRWIDIPEEGRTHGDYEEPSPQLTIVPRS